MAANELDKPARISESQSAISPQIVEPMIPVISKGVRELIDTFELPLVEPRLYEVQTKFRMTGNMLELLQQPRVEFVARVYQQDFYLPILGQPEELVRIRRQGNKITFGYKGARVEGSRVRIRPKFEVEIDEKTEQELMRRHGIGAKEVTKVRDLYQLNGVIICADSVVVRRGEEVIPAGQFIEIRTTEKERGEDLLRETSQALGLAYGERINASYLDIQLGQKEYTAFPESEGEISPADLYERMSKTFSIPRNEAYFSSPLTSGGAKRLYEGREDFSQQIPAIIRLNGQFSETIARESEDLVMAYKFTLPHLIGSRQGWGEADYMRFWMYYLSGISVDEVKEFEDKLKKGELGIDTNIFNDYVASRAKRVKEYEKMVDSFVSFIKDQRLSINPVSVMLCLPDYQLSVGCSSEVRLAKALKIPLQEVTFDKEHPGFRNRIAPIAQWLQEGTVESHIPNASNYVVIFKPVV